MKKQLSKRVLSLLLAFALVFGAVVPVGAAGNASKSTELSFREVSAASGLDRIGEAETETAPEPEYEETDVVRVSIVLNQKSTLQAGFSTTDIAANSAAMTYRSLLEVNQAAVVHGIEAKLGQKLDVAWNLTLAANLISANVAYGDLDAISAVPGVEEVVIENRYEPCVVEDSVSEDPEMLTSTLMSGAVNVWNSGYTGAGSRVAVIDTGIDTDHQSFSAKGFEYSLGLNAAAEGKTEEEYLAELDLLDVEEIASVLDQLNISGVSADRLYVSSKIPFGYNYIDQNYKVTHDYDSQGEHGSHVEGIAAANAYIPQRDGTFAEALELTNVKGVAPDAQIISMKVFGVNGGAYDSDYMAAIEDAIVLGCDSVNLSLGSGSAGFSFNATYQELLEGLQQTDTVVTISAGNSYGWDDFTDDGLYVEDVRFATNGSPGSFSNSLAVASVESTSFNEDGTYTEPDYYTMSDFSSWGVPESLELKPEITAPGGNIYSVNGSVAGGKSYETMSGTSMAAPQMAGMVAVMAQYIRENDLTAETGLTVRQLAQSLLMSTALPLLNEDTDYYYSVLQQGSGMAKLDAAAGAKSYIQMGDDATAYAADGKVKAELGDDPDRSGVYSFRFTLTNFSDTQTGYRLHTDLFTQDTDGEYLLQRTAALMANVVYKVDGVTYVPASTGVDCDLNGDGITDAQDAQIILNYTAGLIAEIDAMADTDGSGTVDTYDAHLILEGLETGIVTVQPGQSVTIQVTAALTQEQKEELDASYPNGAYIEGFVYANPTENAEGVACDSTHSIPLLGFYGNWSDPSMFGVSYSDILYGDDRDPYVGDAENNNLVVSRDGEQWFQVGNPYVVEDSYPQGKDAVRSTDILDSYRFTLLRNAGAIMLSITDEAGSELYRSGVTNQLKAAYYYVNAGAWQNISNSYTLGMTAAELGLEENDRFTVTVTAIPEYYILGQTMDAEAMYDIMASGVLGEGASLTTELVVDNTAPKIVSISKDVETGELIVTCTDNQYVAAMSLVSLDGTKTYATAAADQEGALPGGLQQVTMDLTGVKAGETCLVSVGDYAGNETTYEVSLGLEADEGGSGGGSTGGTGGSLYAYSTLYGSGWVSIDPVGSTYATCTKNSLSVTAAEYVDGYAYMVGSDSCLYVAPHGNWDNCVQIADWSAYGIEDMAFNYIDNQLYAIGDGNTVYTVNLYTGALTKEFSVTIVNSKAGSSAACYELRGLAINDEGTFYAVSYGGDGYEFATQLYKFTKDQVVDGAITDLQPMKNKYGSTAYVSGYGDNGQTLAWDHENDKLYYYSCGRHNIDSFGYFNLDETGWSTGSLTSISGLKLGLPAMYFVGTEVGVIENAAEAESLTVGTNSLKMMPGSSATIAATVKPWTLKDQSLTWGSSDETVVTVKNGVVTALAAGSATITVTTNAAPYLSEEISVTVSALPEVELYGMLQDENGTDCWVKFNSAAPANWEVVGYGDNSNSFGAVNLNDVIYVHDTDQVFAMDPDTFQKESVFDIGSAYIWPDAAEAPGTEDGYFDRIVAPCYYGEGVAVINPYAATVVDFDVTDVCGSDPLVTMAYAGSARVSFTSDAGNTYDNCPAYTYYSISEAGAVYKLVLTAYPDETDDGVADENYGFAIQRVSGTGLSLTNAAAVGEDDFAASIYDAESGCLVVISYQEGDTTARVYAVEPEGGATCALGDVGDAVWPAYSLYQYTAPTELTLRVRTESLSLYVNDTGKISASVAPTSFTGGLTYTSSNEAVATVDATGVVTAVGPGEAVITVTTVDTDAQGSHLSAEIPVTVEDVVKIDLTVNAKVDFDDEGSNWVTIHTTDLSNPTVIAYDHAYLYSGTAYDGKLYGNDGKAYIDGNYWAVVSNLYVIEPAYDYDITPGGLIGYQNMPTDMTYMPAYALSYTDAEGNAATITAGDMPIYMDISQQLIMWNIYEEGEVAALSGWNLEGSFDGTPGALAYLGMVTQEDDDGVEREAYSYAVLTDSGNLYTVNIIPYVVLDEDGIAAVDYSAFIDELGNVGLEFDSSDAMNMVYVNDGTNTGLLVGYTDKTAELYYVDVDADLFQVHFSSGKIGNIPGTNTFGAMYFAEDLNPTQEAPDFATGNAQSLERSAEIGPNRTVEVQSKITNDVLAVGDGSLNAAKANVRPKAEGETDDGTLAIEITEDVTVTNGIVEITYDPAVLTYAGTSSNLLTAANAQEGKIILSYASGKEVLAGNVLATLNFTYAADYISTTVSVKATQRNADGTVAEEADVITVTCEKGGHDYQVTESKEATCTADGYQVWTCSKCGDSYTEELAATGHSYEVTVVAPTCTEGGYTLHTCRCGDSFQSDPTEPAGHTWGEWVVTKEATCTEDGEQTRSCRFGDAAETEIIPANCPSEAFADVTLEDWFHKYVDYVVEKGLMKGISDTAFDPDGTMTRGQMVTVLYRLAGEPAVESKAPFTDVADGRYYTDAVAWAYENGIVKGVTAQLFCPDAAMTREQMVTFFARYAQWAGLTVEAEGDLNDFADAEAVHSYAVDSMIWAVEVGLITGMGNRTLNPGGTSTRAQVATVLLRFAEMGK